MDNATYIRQRGEERSEQIFRPDFTRVIKPRDEKEVSDVAYTEEDRAAAKEKGQ